MSELPDHILEVARQRARALPPWTDAQLAELARIVDSAPREQPAGHDAERAS